MTVTVIDLHVDQADGGPCWWAESASAPGFTAVADTLHHLREVIAEAAWLGHFPPGPYREHLT